jgi:hypothetical protein
MLFNDKVLYFLIIFNFYILNVTYKIKLLVMPDSLLSNKLNGGLQIIYSVLIFAPFFSNF